MYKVMRYWFFIVIACLFFVGSLDFAEGKPKGQSDSPPGWDKGEKKGWHSDEPPGRDKGKKKEKVKKDKGEDNGSSDDKSKDDEDSRDDDNSGHKNK